MRKTPTVYVIAGPNGAGKTTFASSFLPHFVKCRTFLNADLIAAGLSPFNPESQNLRAGRLLLELIDEQVKNREDFGFETTLSGRTYVRILKEMKSRGYRVCLFFLWLPSVEVAINRVALRVQQGGHDIPIEDIRRRYKAGLRNLFQLYLPLLDELWLYDASELTPNVIAKVDENRLSIENQQLYQQITRQVEASHE